MEIRNLVAAEEALEAVEIVWRLIETDVLKTRLKGARVETKYTVTYWDMAQEDASSTTPD